MNFVAKAESTEMQASVCISCFFGVVVQAVVVNVVHQRYPDHGFQP